MPKPWIEPIDERGRSLRLRAIAMRKGTCAGLTTEKCLALADWLERQADACEQGLADVNYCGVAL